ncbi:MAG: S-adenosylmethionine:tRNA ribosyltransferase-isomerase, partial [Myxococcales bacterium]
MRLSDLDYDLPEELVAQQPLSQRDASRLLLVDVGTAGIEHHRFSELPKLLPPSLFIFNDTRVFPARLTGTKATGGSVELLLLHKSGEARDR